MKFKFKKFFSVICIISILVVVAVTPMLHTHTCHDTNCLVDNSHACHDTDCAIYLLINKYECLFSLMLLGLGFLNLVNLKSVLLSLKLNFEWRLYNNLVKQKVKLTN
jgi:hypothetical protein